MIAETQEITIRRSTADVVTMRARLRCKRRLLWMRNVWGHSQSASTWAISESEVERVLEDPRETAEKEHAFYQSNSAAHEIDELLREVEEEFASLAEWSRLRRQFGLSEFEVNLLSLAVACEIDPQLKRVYGYLQDDASAGYATPWLAAQLFEGAFTPPGPQSPLVQWHMAKPVEGAAQPWSAVAAWVVDPQIVSWLVGERRFDAALGSAVQWIAKADAERQMQLYPRQLEEMIVFVRSLWPAADAAGAILPDAIEIELLGADGSGKRTLAAQFAAAFDADLLIVDAEALFAGDVSHAAALERVMRARRMAVLGGALLYWNHCEHVNRRVWQAAGISPGVTVFAAAAPELMAERAAVPKRAFALLPLRREQRIELWTRLSPEPEPVVIAEWVLNPAEIVAAAQAAAAGADAIVEACQVKLAGASKELFAAVSRPYTWDDIVLPYHVREHLEEFEQQVRLRWQVYEEWGFERLCAMGSGVSALFAGPSGTGKTMAAQVLARSLGMQLYRVDLSGVMNKYIGETEKRLKQVFDACERANVLLFFDEADALFGQRTQVKDAHDRFANIEIDYLLQRMEQFTGVTVLATNRRGDLDKAFVRRMRFIIEFQQPGPAERLALWRRALPERSPAGEELLEGIDWDWLAQKLNMTGADIASAAMAAAFLARGGNARIGMDHVRHAARREMSKHGIAARSMD